ncbi:Uncharacterised protein [Mycobacteroides abscessus subsp. abscessus]|nr:Uncharacterised protein [Mycobacteroides abscessus subsp. abscessus]
MQDGFVAEREFDVVEAKSESAVGQCAGLSVAGVGGFVDDVVDTVDGRAGQLATDHDVGQQACQ